VNRMISFRAPEDRAVAPGEAFVCVDRISAVVCPDSGYGYVLVDGKALPIHPNDIDRVKERFRAYLLE
jgi:hypothetical protein